MNEDAHAVDGMATEREPAGPGDVSGPTAGMFIGRILAGTVLIVICGVTLVGYYWRQVGAEPAMIWLGVLLLLLTLRIALVAVVPYSEYQEQSGWAWVALYPVGINLIAAWLGVAGAWAVFHVPPSDQVLMWVVLFSLSAFSITAVALAQSWMLMVAVLALGGPLVAAFLNDQAGHLALIVFAILFVAGLAYFFRRQGELVRRVVESGREADALVQSLSNSRQRLQAEVLERKEYEVQIQRSANALRLLMDNVQDLIFRTAEDGTILQISPSSKSVLGYDSEDLAGRKLGELMADPDDFDRLLAELDERDGRTDDFSVELAPKDGGKRWFSGRFKLRHDDESDQAALEGALRDVTETLLTERALQVVQDRAQTTLDSIGDGVLTTDGNGLVEFLNPVAERMTGWTLREARGEPLMQVLKLIEQRSGRAAPDPVERCKKSGTTVALPGTLAVVRRNDETESVVEVSASPMSNRAQSEVSGVVVVLHDVTRVQDLSRELSYQAAHDTLTGLLNRTEFENHLAHAIDAVTDDEPHALLMVDLDQFRAVNDANGHAAGDELLRQVADIIRLTVRDSDRLARMGADEFGVLLERCPSQNADRVARNILERLRDLRFEWEGKSFEVTASIGLVAVTEATGDITQALRAADSARIMAKETGRDRVHAFRSDDARMAEQHGLAQWVNRIQEAIDEDRFELLLQPIKPLREKHRPRAGEILLRLKGPGKELILPNAFLPAAERYHLMPRVDRWVVRKALATIASRPASLLPYGEIAINVSGQSLNSDSFFEFITSEIEASGVKPELLCFEITETAVIANLYKARALLSELKRLGCKFALDDFGSGLSSFQYLRQLEVDKLKIDGAFIRNIAEDPVDYAMVRAIVQVGQTMGIETVAEYVENADILEKLEELEVDHAQGFYLASPAPIV